MALDLVMAQVITATMKKTSNKLKTAILNCLITLQNINYDKF